jgi:hypothetical protein
MLYWQTTILTACSRYDCARNVHFSQRSYNKIRLAGIDIKIKNRSCCIIGLMIIFNFAGTFIYLLEDAKLAATLSV